MGVCPLREQLNRMYQRSLALCRRTRTHPIVTEHTLVGIYFRYLPDELGAQVWDMASDTELETLYTAAKFAAARDDRRTTHPLPRNAQGASQGSGDIAELFAITGDFADAEAKSQRT